MTKFKKSIKEITTTTRESKVKPSVVAMVDWRAGDVSAPIISDSENLEELPLTKESIQATKRRLKKQQKEVKVAEQELKREELKNRQIRAKCRLQIKQSDKTGRKLRAQTKETLATKDHKKIEKHALEIQEQFSIYFKALNEFKSTLKGG